MESAILPRHEDFEKIYQNFIEEYGEEEGKNKYYAWLNEHGYDDTKPMPKKESFSWIGDVQTIPGVQNLIRGEALHPLKTVHPEEWPSVRVYLEEELQKAAHTLADKPLLLDHSMLINGKVTGAQYEDGAIEYVAQVNDPRILDLIKDGAIKHCSVEFEWKSLEHVNGLAPKGINFTSLSLLKNFAPGDPLSTVELVEVWEGIIKQLKEAKQSSSFAKEQAEPQEFIYYPIRDPAAFLEERFSTIWLDQTNGIQAIYGRLREDSESPQPMALLFMKASGWNMEKMRDWLNNHPQYVRQSTEPVAAVAVQPASPTPSQPPAPVMEGKAEEKRPSEEPKVKKTESKPVGEAIIPSQLPPQPPNDFISKREVLALLPNERVIRSWSFGPQLLVRQLRHKLQGEIHE